MDLLHTLVVSCSSCCAASWNLKFDPPFFILYFDLLSWAQCSGKLELSFVSSSYIIVYDSTETFSVGKCSHFILNRNHNMRFLRSHWACKWHSLFLVRLLLQCHQQRLKSTRLDQSEKIRESDSFMHERTQPVWAERESQWVGKKSTILWSLPTMSCSPAPGSRSSSLWNYFFFETVDRVASPIHFWILLKFHCSLLRSSHAHDSEIAICTRLVSFSSFFMLL